MGRHLCPSPRAARGRAHPRRLAAMDLVASEVAPAGTEELLETVAELERFASAANDSATVALLDECVAELERRRAAARPAPLGELQRTATELRRLVASTTNSELRSMLSQTEAEIGRRHARRGR